MGRNYVTSGTAVVVLLCACVVMAASDVTGSSSTLPSWSSSRRDSLAKILEELRRLSQANKHIRSQMHGLASDVVADYGELERHSRRDSGVSDYRKPERVWTEA